RIVPAGAGALAADRGTLGPRIGADGVPVLPHRDRVRVAHAGIEGTSLDDLVAACREVGEQGRVHAFLGPQLPVQGFDPPAGRVDRGLGVRAVVNDLCQQ